MSPRRAPHEMRVAPALAPGVRPGPVEPRYALLINPFYPKDPHTSFGKHVLTPSLALTSIAAATPPHWHVRYWDENLLQGPPPWKPFPQVVGITVHLTFAQRAYVLARWYRRRGAKVILGGLHVTSCPRRPCRTPTRWPSARASNFGRKSSPTSRRASSRRSIAATTPALSPRAAAAAQVAAAGKLPYHRRADRHPRLPQPLRLLLPGHPRPAHALHDARRGAGGRGVAQLGQPYAVFMDNNLGSDAEYLRRLCRALRPLELIWSAAVSIDVTDDPSLVRNGPGRLHGRVRGLREPSTPATSATRGSGVRPAEDYAHRTAVFHDHGVHVNGSFVFGFDHDGPEVFEKTVAWIEANRLACATFHILTPYPGTPLFRADGGPRAALAQELEPLRHGPRGVSPAAHDARTTGRGLCLVLSPLVFARLDLAAPAGQSPRRAGLPGDGLSLQAGQSDVVVPDPPPPYGRGVAADAGLVAAGALAFSPPAPRPAAGTSPCRRKKSNNRWFWKSSGQTSVSFALDDDQFHRAAQDTIAACQLAAVAIQRDEGVGVAMEVQNGNLRPRQRGEPVDGIVLGEVFGQFAPASCRRRRHDLSRPGQLAWSHTG